MVKHGVKSELSLQNFIFGTYATFTELWKSVHIGSPLVHSPKRKSSENLQRYVLLQMVLKLHNCNREQISCAQEME